MADLTAGLVWGRQNHTGMGSDTQGLERGESPRHPRGERLGEGREPLPEFRSRLRYLVAV